MIKLGDDYFLGTNGTSQDYSLAKLCYEEAVSLNPSDAHAVQSLEIISEYGQYPIAIKPPEYYENVLFQSNVKKQQLILENICLMAKQQDGHRKS